jgi:hypothetical protein
MGSHSASIDGWKMSFERKGRMTLRDISMLTLRLDCFLVWSIALLGKMVWGTGNVGWWWRYTMGCWRGGNDFGT